MATTKIRLDTQALDGTLTAVKLNADVAGSGLVLNGGTNALDIALESSNPTLKITDDKIGLKFVTTYLQTGSNGLDVKAASANGLATLDAGGKIPVAQLPNSVMEFKGAWDATNNDPVLDNSAIKASKVIQDLTYSAKTAGEAGNSITISYTDTVTQGNEVASRVGNAYNVAIEDGVSTATQVKAAVDSLNELVDVTISGTGSNAQTVVTSVALLAGQDQANAGDVYRTSVAGSHNFGQGSLSFAIGDFVIYNGTIWQKSPATDAVVSVNSKTGAVTLVTDDIAEDGDPVNLWFTTSRAKAAAVADSISDGVTDVAPSQNAVFDALALKLAKSLTSAYIFVGNGSDVATGVAMSGDITISNTGATAIGSQKIADANIKTDAAITLSKLAAVTANRVLLSDASGYVSASSVSNTTLGYLDATSSIQTQLNAKLGASNLVTRESPNEAPNGAITEFTVDNTPVAGTECVYLNGILQNAGGNDYTLDAENKKVTFTFAPATGSVILVSYQK